MYQSKNLNKYKKIIICIFFFTIIFICKYLISLNLELNENQMSKFDYQNSKFIVIKRTCKICGLFSLFITNLGCIHKFLKKGYIPIIDLKSYPNVLNGCEAIKDNHWELFFEQPFGFTLEKTLKYGKNIEYKSCEDVNQRPNDNMANNKVSINFWHNFAKKYMPIKQEIINLANKKMKDLFNDSTNVLGVLARGTDYTSMKPKYHPIPPSIDKVISDVKELDKKNNYDWIFFSTEDEKIREKFTKVFLNKVKQLNKIKIDYNYTSKYFININKNIYGNVKFNKQYLLNILILSKCLDIVAARCSGTAGILVLSNGFRYMKIYNYGEY